MASVWGFVTKLQKVRNIENEKNHRTGSILLPRRALYTPIKPLGAGFNSSGARACFVRTAFAFSSLMPTPGVAQKTQMPAIARAPLELAERQGLLSVIPLGGGLKGNHSGSLRSRPFVFPPIAQASLALAPKQKAAAHGLISFCGETGIRWICDSSQLGELLLV